MPKPPVSMTPEQEFRWRMAQAQLRALLAKMHTEAGARKAAQQ